MARRHQISLRLTLLACIHAGVVTGPTQTKHNCSEGSFWQLDLTGKQQIAAHKLFRRAVKSEASKLESNTRIVPNIERTVVVEQEFISAIGKDNWAKLDPFIRQYIAEQESESEVESTNDDE